MLDAAVVNELQDRLLSWYATNGRDLPWRETRDPYAILVSETMLQQTQVSRVLPRYREWLLTYPDLEALAAASLSDVLRRWQGLGYNNRARRLRDCAAAVVASAPEERACLPVSEAALRGFPGIGPYTARALLVFAHGWDVAAVDTNVRRVLTFELGLAADLRPSELQRVAEAVVPAGRSRDWHNALMDYGALVLTSRVTGTAPIRRQSVFEGSRRWQRSRLLRLLLEHGAQDVTAIARALGVSAHDARDLVGMLERDGLVVLCGEQARIA